MGERILPANEAARVQASAAPVKRRPTKGEVFTFTVFMVAIGALAAGTALAVAHYRFGAFMQMANHSLTRGGVGVIVLFTVGGTAATFVVCKKVYICGRSLGQASSEVSAETSGNISGAIVRKAFAPLNKGERPYCAPRISVLQELSPRGVKPAETVSIKTLDGKKLDGIWCNGQRSNLRVTDEQELNPTVIIFHGNGCIADSMYDMAQWYQKRGMNVLMVTIRGYYGSEGDAVADGEQGMIYDADAAVRFAVKERNIRLDNLIVHGYSLGGAYAGIAAGVYGLNATFSNTFTTAGDVAANIGEEYVADWFIKAFVRGAYGGSDVTIPSEEAMKGVTRIPTNRVNTEERAKTANNVFAFYAFRDDLMKHEFARRIVEAKYGKDDPSKIEQNLCRLYGTHTTQFMNNAEASAKYEEYLRSIGFMTSAQ